MAQSECMTDDVMFKLGQTALRMLHHAHTEDRVSGVTHTVSFKDT